MGTFPFGWVRGVTNENWQIIWSAEESVLYVKGALSKKLIDIGPSSTWEEAKALADKVQNEPDSYIKPEDH